MRDLGVIWKFVGIVVAVGAAAGALIAWGVSLEKTDTALAVKINALENDVATLKRDFRWHERTHPAMTSPIRPKQE
jgi:hypothetical protein